MTRLDPLAAVTDDTAYATWRTAVPAWDATWRAVDDDDDYRTAVAATRDATWDATNGATATIADATADATAARGARQ